MPGTIRVVVGMLIAMGSVGGIDTASDSKLVVLCVIASLGLSIMYSGVQAMRKE
jgi:hypothetical protein